MNQQCAMSVLNVGGVSALRLRATPSARTVGALTWIFHNRNKTPTACRGPVARHCNVETVTAQRLLDIGMSSYGPGEKTCEISALSPLPHSETTRTPGSWSPSATKQPPHEPHTDEDNRGLREVRDYHVQLSIPTHGQTLEVEAVHESVSGASFQARPSRLMFTLRELGSSRHLPAAHLRDAVRSQQTTLSMNRQVARLAKVESAAIARPISTLES